MDNAIRVIRVGDGQWSSEDDSALEKLMGVLKQRAEDCSHCTLESLLVPPPRVSHGNDHAYILFGPRKIWVDAENQYQADIRGLVFEPVVRQSRKGNIVLNL
jgi:hypothetical protein